MHFWNIVRVSGVSELAAVHCSKLEEWDATCDINPLSLVHMGCKH